MSQSISNLKDDLIGITHGANLNKVKNLNSLFFRAAGNLLAMIDSVETKRTMQLTNAIHDDVYDYSAPADLKGNKVIDIRPQVNRGIQNNFSQGFTEDFDLRKALKEGKEIFTVRHNSGTKSLRIAATHNSKRVTIHACDNITDNGTWAASSDASNLTQDTLNYVSGSASLRFDLAAGGTSGVLTNSTLTQVDITDHDEVGSLFLWLYFPTGSAITSVNLRWGNSSTVYWNRSVTATHEGLSFQNGWNLLRFDWNGATETGTVDPAVIDYVRVAITYSSASILSACRLDNIVVSIGSIYEIEYYSKYLFQTSAGTWQETTSADGDIINLDTESYNLFRYECALAIAQQLQGEDSNFDVNYFRTELYGDGSPRNPGKYKLYAMSNPSEAIKRQSSYYRI